MNARSAPRLGWFRSTLIVLLWLGNLLPLPAALDPLIADGYGYLLVMWRYFLCTFIAIVIAWPVLSEASVRLWPRRWRHLGRIVAMIGLILVLRVIVLVAFGEGDIPKNQVEVLSFVSRLSWLGLVGMLVVAAPLLEELVFREILIGQGMRLFSPFLGVERAQILLAILSVGLFTWAHAPGLAWLDVLLYLPLSIGLVWLYFGSGRNIMVVLLGHALNNGLAVAMILAMKQMGMPLV